jgi:ribosomal protein S18 acetylase RimI-like enzyme
MTADGAAAVVWLPPPGRWQVSPSQRVRLLPPLVRFLGLRTASILGGLDRMEERHPHHPSHWYLFILGTEQAAQGQGLGSALLAQVLTRIDADGMPVYLESPSERNLALYGRHGFEVTSEVAIPGGPRIWPMWREPRT